METSKTPLRKIALVFGNLPTVDEIDQFRLLRNDFEITVVSTESICGYLNETCRFGDLRCLALPDHEENPTYIPGLDKVLGEFDVVVLKERLGLYAYQAVKSKWRNRFRLIVWVDNLATLPAEDVDQMRTIRDEVTNAADAFIVQSESAATTLLLEGVEAERILRFRPWVDKIAKRTKKDRAIALEAFGLPESAFIVGHFGQVEWEEGLGDLAAAVKLIKSRDHKLYERLYLVFCGIGSYAPQLKQSLIALGVDDKVIFVAPSRDAFIALNNSANCLFHGTTPSRDRVEGEPYRIVSAMANLVPLLANRTPIVEEICGKHRVDFCFGSPESIADGIMKVSTSSSLIGDIVQKNEATIRSRFNQDTVADGMRDMFAKIYMRQPSVDPSSLDHQVLEVESLVASKQYLKAIDMIESIFQITDVPVHHRANLYRLIGDCFAKLSDNDGAKNAYIKAIELDPYSAKAYIGLGTIGLVKRSNDIAVIHFQKAVSLAPQDEMANLGLGLAFQGMDELDEAHNWVTKALDINPYNPAALYTLVRIAYERNKFEVAEKAVCQYLVKHPHDYNMMFTLGGIQFKCAKYQEVIRLCTDIIKIDPMDAKAHQLLKQAQRAIDQSLSSNG